MRSAAKLVGLIATAAILVGSAGTVTLGRPWYSTSEVATCEDCLTARTSSTLNLGWRRVSVPMRRSSIEFPSRAQTDLLHEIHVDHHWVGGNGWQSPKPAVRVYQGSEAFRTYVHEYLLDHREEAHAVVEQVLRADRIAQSPLLSSFCAETPCDVLIATQVTIPGAGTQRSR
jgi:hypothetical protein